MKLKFKTKLNVAKKEGSTLRTTVPAKIIEALKLEKSDSLVWELDKTKGEWVVSVKKE